MLSPTSEKHSIGAPVSAFASSAEALLSMAARQEALTEDESALVRYYVECIASDVLKQRRG